MSLPEGERVHGVLTTSNEHPVAGPQRMGHRERAEVEGRSSSGGAQSPGQFLF